MNNKLITLSNVSKEYVNNGQRINALDDVSFTIRQGKSLGVVGGSGSGKTTIAKIIAGIEVATRGHVYCFSESGDSDIDHKTWIQKNLGYVFQDPYSSLNPRMTVIDSIAEPLTVRSSRRVANLRERVIETLNMVSLDQTVARLKPHQLSGGQRQRVCIARALIASPKLIVLDEPTAALDIITQANLINLLNQLKLQTDTTFVFISHHLALVEALVDEMIVIADGRIRESGSVGELFSNPQHEHTKALLSNTPKLSHTSLGL
jgi:ABC-type glutathione transport system ATPase component